MSQNSYPKVETPFTDDQWKNLFLTLGRGIIDKGGWPYKLTNRDSVTNTVTLGVSSIDGQAWAVLDGFVHHMDAPEQISVPPVTVDTTYEIGLIYDPQKHQSLGGPLTLTSWVAPGDTSSGKQYLVMYRMTRKNNLALGSTPFTEERPRAVPVFSVSQESQLPVNSLSLVDSLGIVRTTNELFRADMDMNGAITWRRVGGSTEVSGYATDQELSEATKDLRTATASIDGGAIVKRWGDGAVSGPDPSKPEFYATRRYVDGKNWPGSSITSTIPFQHVDGSTAAWQNTNLGSTWATVAVNSAGFLGRYPSALKYKKNVRSWNITPATVYGVTPVKYEDKQNGDTRVGFVADSYVNTIPELVETNPDTGEVEGWRYMLMCVAQQVAIRDLNDRVSALEAMLTTPDESAGA